MFKWEREPEMARNMMKQIGPRKGKEEEIVDKGCFRTCKIPPFKISYLI